MSLEGVVGVQIPEAQDSIANSEGLRGNQRTSGGLPSSAHDWKEIYHIWLGTIASVKKLRNWGTWNMGSPGEFEFFCQCLGVASWKWEWQSLPVMRRE